VREKREQADGGGRKVGGDGMEIAREEWEWEVDSILDPTPFAARYSLGGSIPRILYY